MFLAAQKIKDEERRRKEEFENQKLKEWEIKFDNERQKQENEDLMREEELRIKDEERKKKLEFELRKPEKPH